MARLSSIATLLLTIALSTGIGATAQSQQEKDIVKAFSKTVEEYIPSHFIKEPLPVQVGCGWNKHLYEPSANHSIDVRKTDSLISPYIGTVQFVVTSSLTNCHPTEEEAKKDNAYRRFGTATHRYTFAYQEDTWVLKSREILSEKGGNWVCSIGPEPCQ